MKSVFCPFISNLSCYNFGSVLVVLLTALIAACGGGGGGAASGGGAPSNPPAVSAAAPTPQELQCQAQGWRRGVVEAVGLQRLVLWQVPANWRGEAIVLMHGGGGTHTNYCAANVAVIEPQVRFSQAALARGFAVFLLDSHDQVTDTAGRLCGKIWDDEVRTRPNVDLPFIDGVLRELVQAQRGNLPRTQTFLMGHSSGAFMTIRAASHFGPRITAFAPVAPGSPYGWTRDCTRRPGDRVNVAGVGLDNDTGRQIPEVQACFSANGQYPNEKPWDGATLSPKPAFRVFHHEQDGILDASCVERARSQLAQRGYPETPAFKLTGGSRNADAHNWLDNYNAPVLDFFSTFLR